MWFTDDNQAHVFWRNSGQEIGEGNCYKVTAVTNSETPACKREILKKTKNSKHFKNTCVIKTQSLVQLLLNVTEESCHFG